MAFFGLIGNYDKPGPGVSKDEPKKAAPVRFFEILWRKLSKLVQLNLIFMIPFAVVVALMVVIFFLPLPHFAFNTSLLGRSICTRSTLFRFRSFSWRRFPPVWPMSPGTLPERSTRSSGLIFGRPSKITGRRRS